MARFARLTVRTAEAVFPVPSLVALTGPVVLVYVPVTALVTFTLTTQKPPTGMVPPVRLMLPEPAAAVNVPPPQFPVAPFGVATTTLAGRGSLKATPVAGTGLIAGFVIVKLSAETPVGAMSAGLNALPMEGGRSTRRLAEAAAPAIRWKLPVPSSNVAVTAVVVFTLLPPPVAVTLTVNEHVALPVRLDPVITIALFPGVASMLPSQVLVRPLGVATTSPLGSGSVSATLVNIVAEFGLAKLK